MAARGQREPTSPPQTDTRRPGDRCAVALLPLRARGICRCCPRAAAARGQKKRARAGGRENKRPVRLAYQPPANSTFLSEQTSHQQPASSTLLSEQTSTSHQPPANRTGCSLLLPADGGAGLVWCPSMKPRLPATDRRGRNPGTQGNDADPVHATPAQAGRQARASRRPRARSRFARM
jgi:hypothetical protein